MNSRISLDTGTATALAVANLPTPELAEALAVPATTVAALIIETRDSPAVPDQGQPDQEKAVRYHEFRALDRMLEDAI